MNKPLKSIARISVVDQAIQNLQNYITDNNLQPGDKLPTEKEVCEMMGIGRSTAREAYRMLKAMDYVTAIQGKGIFLSDKYRKNDSNEMALEWFRENGRSMIEFMEVRMAIEPMAVRLAIPRATDSDIEALEKTHFLFQQALNDKNTVKLLSYDELFHNQIMEFTDNQLMIRISQNITECFRSYRSKAFAVDKIMGNAVTPHANYRGSNKGYSASGYNLQIEHLGDFVTNNNSNFIASHCQCLPLTVKDQWVFSRVLFSHLCTIITFPALRQLQLPIFPMIRTRTTADILLVPNEMIRCIRIKVSLIFLPSR